ncbi:MAG: permease-like cell division protein FtsX [Candidatus Peribacteria bacterium]|jgi:cell division transport system permease protein|nr:permease-like cell division protein FtsX [Candidatus Peribacteria bacterium]
MLFRIFKYSIKNSLRNKFLTFSSILVLTLLMLFVNILSMLQNISNTLINSINSKLTISLYIKDEYTETSLEIGDLINEIEKLNKSIQVEYKTKDKILSEIRQREPDLVKIIEKDNPLPDTIVISNIGITDYEKLNDLIIRREYLLANDESQNNYFANYTTQYKKIQDIISILHILQI